MKVLTSSEMKEIDRKTIEEVGIPSLVLMENAASGVLEAILRRFPEVRRILVVAGKGNNGGDGIALSRRMKIKGIETDLYLPLGTPKGDAGLQLRIAKKVGVKVVKGKPKYNSYDLIVDALFGTGFKPPAEGVPAEVIEEINRSDAPVVAVDVPSGLSADTGTLFEPSVKADLTVTFQFPKVCHLLFPAAKRCGEVEVVDISIPNHLAEAVPRETIDVSRLVLPSRERDTYKTREGHVLIVGGSRGKTGAVVMAGKAATRTGSGLVTIGVPEGLNGIVESLVIEEMTLPLPKGDTVSYFSVDLILDLQDRFSALALGMGMGRYEEGQDIVRDIVKGWRKPLLLDADGLNNLADLGPDILKEREGVTVLTPHIGEFARLTGLPPDEITANQTEVARTFSKEWGCFVVLKGARTVVGTPEGKVWISTRGTPAMAKGGAGDVLSGILLALLGKDLDPEEALKTGVVLHGIAGEIAERRTHRESLRATDIIEAIPEAYSYIENFSRKADTIN
ncbi:MAG: NAD(P)H-hydrate dehydratase [Aquificota bacterium]|nr:NAD(P)H-hydrate dehydratase [Aquificota bacterium]